MEKLDVRLSGQIRFIREVHGYSQEAIASFLGISQQAYQKIESGKAKVCDERLSQIAEFLGVDKRKLIKIDKEEILQPFQKDNPNSMRHRLKEEVLAIRAELKVLKQLNQRILKELEM